VLVVEGSAGEGGGTDGLELDVGRAGEETRGVGVDLRLDDLVEDGVDVCGWDVGFVAAVVGEGADEG
jgi:hypothetical protein